MQPRPLELKGYAPISAPSSFGKPPRLEWLPINDLVIDPAYQREITLVGRKQVRAIGERFSWAKFKVPVVAAAGGGKYAIVDGQHRVTAAALVGIERVPCAIIDANQAEQADAFRAINGSVTRMSALQIFHASVAAGDPQAVIVRDVCARAGVSISRHATQAILLKPGTTLTVSAIQRCIWRFGEASCELGLRMVMASSGGAPTALTRTIIWGTIEVLHDHKEWHQPAVRLRTAFEGLDLEELSDRARVAAARQRGTSQTDQFEGLLVEALETALRQQKALA